MKMWNALNQVTNRTSSIETNTISEPRWDFSGKWDSIWFNIHTIQDNNEVVLDSFTNEADNESSGDGSTQHTLMFYVRVQPLERLR